jgi:hypothetical protein
MRRFDEKIQHIETQLNEWKYLKRGAEYLGRQAANIAKTPIQVASSAGQLVKSGLDTAVDVGKNVGKAVTNPGEMFAGAASIPVAAAKAAGNLLSDPTGVGKSFGKAVANYIPDTVKKVADKTTGTLQSVGKGVETLAKGGDLLSPGTIARATGTKTFDGKKYDRTVTGHAIDAADKATSAVATAKQSVNPAHAAAKLAIDTGTDMLQRNKTKKT